MVKKTSKKVKQITEELYQGGHIDEMTVSGYHRRLQTLQEYQFFTLSQRYTNQPHLDSQ